MTTADWPELDPGVRQWLAEAAAAPAGSSVEVTREYSRRNQTVLLRRLPAMLRAASVLDRQVDGPAGPLTVRIYTPSSATGPVPLLVHFHGGGWVIGDLDTHLGHCHRICAEAGAVVVSIGYRVAPEHRFPAAFDDSLALTEWAAANAAEFGADPNLVVVGGDSAGAQLAASVAIAGRDQGRPLAGQLLLYPVTAVDGRYADPAINAMYPSRSTQALGPGLTLDGMAYFARAYVDAADAADWRVSPLNAEPSRLAGVAPAVVHTAALDLLRDEGNRYAGQLRAAGVPVIAREFPALNHSYFPLGGVSAAAGAAAAQASVDLRALLGLAPLAAP